jgi:DNA-binding MarR family transcriptional regulator
MKPRPAQSTAWRSFLEAHAVVTDALARELEEERGLPLPWYDVLVQLSEAPGQELRMAELARSVLLSKSGLTRLVDRMENAGLVERRPCDADGRGLLAALTPDGRDTLRRAAPVHLRGIEEHFARYLTEAEARTLRSVFAKILRAHETAADIAS